MTQIHGLCHSEKLSNSESAFDGIDSKHPTTTKITSMGMLVIFFNI